MIAPLVGYLSHSHNKRINMFHWKRRDKSCIPIQIRCNVRLRWWRQLPCLNQTRPWVFPRCDRWLHRHRCKRRWFHKGHKQRWWFDPSVVPMQSSIVQCCTIKISARPIRTIFVSNRCLSLDSRCQWHIPMWWTPIRRWCQEQCQHMLRRWDSKRPFTVTSSNDILS